MAAAGLGLRAGLAPACGETVRFSSASLPPTPLEIRLARERGTVAAPHPGDPIAAELYRPAGGNPAPAVIALHGCGGRARPEAERVKAARFTDRGYLYLAVDSFAPRGIREECNGAAFDPDDRISDAYGALDWLAAQPFAAPSRIALLGFSQGANVAFAIATANDHTERTQPAKFAAVVLYYPRCLPEYAVTVVPTLIMVGDLDDWTPARQCTDMMARRTGAGAPERLIVYPGARHAFDAVAPQHLFYGHQLAYDEAADHAAADATLAFLGEWLPP